MAYYGWYSLKAVQAGNPAVVWMTGGGLEVEVTEVSVSPSPIADWDDYTSIGQLKKFIREAKPRGILNLWTDPNRRPLF